jgi:hypothetical protein
MAPYPVSRGLRVFLIVWLGQLVSLVGSSLTGFALGVWVYQRTRSVTQFALPFVTYCRVSCSLPWPALWWIAGAIAGPCCSAILARS